MKIHVFLLVNLLILASCGNKKESQQNFKITNPITTISKENTGIQELSIVSETTGDLDNDGTPERAIIYTTTESTEYGNVRELQIQKKENGEWVKWFSSTSAILKDGDGGMMGDPFEGLEVKDGILQIRFFGGSSWKWSYTDKYRFQNNRFELIGYTHAYFKLCEYWETSDYNLVTGKFVIKKEYEKCENKKQFFYKIENETFNKKIDVITLKNRNQKEIKFESPKYKHKIYISSGNL